MRLPLAAKTNRLQKLLASVLYDDDPEDGEEVSPAMQLLMGLKAPPPRPPPPRSLTYAAGDFDHGPPMMRSRSARPLPDPVQAALMIKQERQRIVEEKKERKEAEEAAAADKRGEFFAQFFVKSVEAAHVIQVGAAVGRAAGWLGKRLAFHG